jgi:thiol-disulfide isomerase/thioredoxin
MTMWRGILQFSLLAGIAMATQASAADKVKVGERLPAITLNYLGSSKGFDAKSLEGKIVLVDFWASDCVPCRDAVPELNELYRSKKASGFMLIGINVDENAKDAEDFLKSFKVEYPILDDQKHKLIPKMGVELMPTSYLLDQKGIVRFINKGFRSGDVAKIRGSIDKLSRTKN